jgi:glutamyl-tRNA reductase
MRERVNCSEVQLPHALVAAAECPGVHEVAILSTCNRMEVYALIDTPQIAAAFDPIVRHLASHHHVPEDELTPYLYQKHDQEAALHLMRVASGLDSLVLGEAQILGQVKAALRSAQSAGTIGSTLTGLFQQSISAGRRTQAETGLGKGAFSIGHAAVDLAGKVFGELSHAGVLILGAGKMSEVTARHLRNSGVASVLVANRTYARAEALATKLGGRAIHYDAFPDELRRADIVIASTAAPHPIINRTTLAPVLRKRRGNPLILIDIAVPRDIDTDVLSLDNVFLYNIDDLQAVVAQEAQGRKSEVGRAEAILTDECARFMSWYRNREAAPVITLLKQKLDTIREEELTLLRSQLPGLTEREWQKVEAAFRSMATKVAKEPILRLKRETAATSPSDRADTQTYDLLTATREIFNLHGEAPPAEETTETAIEFAAEEITLPVPVAAGRSESTRLRREVET